MTPTLPQHNFVLSVGLVTVHQEQDLGTGDHPRGDLTAVSKFAQAFTVFGTQVHTQYS